MNPLHYPSLELCKKLTENGFPQTSLSMISGVIQEKRWVSSIEYFQGVVPSVCPSVMELLDEIPDLIVVKDEVYCLQITKGSVEYYSHLMESNIFEAFQPLPDALAYDYLWLKENNYLPTK